MYTNMQEVQVLKLTGERRLDLTSTGDVGQWGPGFVPHIIRAWSIVLDVTPGDAGVIELDLRPTHDSDTNRSTAFGSIALATTHTYTAGSAQPVVYQVLSTPQTVYPGQEVVVQVADASASVDEAIVTLWVEPVYETPGAIAGLSTTTTMTATA